MTHLGQHMWNDWDECLHGPDCLALRCPGVWVYDTPVRTPVRCRSAGGWHGTVWCGRAHADQGRMPQRWPRPARSWAQGTDGLLDHAMRALHRLGGEASTRDVLAAMSAEPGLPVRYTSLAAEFARHPGAVVRIARGRWRVNRLA